MCAGSWVPFLRFPLWEFHVQAICFHVRVSFDKTSQLLRRFGIRSSFLGRITNSEQDFELGIRSPFRGKTTHLRLDAPIAAMRRKARKKTDSG